MSVPVFSLHVKTHRVIWPHGGVIAKQLIKEQEQLRVTRLSWTQGHWHAARRSQRCLLFGLIFLILLSPPGKVSATAQLASFPPGATFLDLGNVDPKRGHAGEKNQTKRLPLFPSFLPSSVSLFPLFLLYKRLGGNEAAKAARLLIVAEALGSVCTADSSQPQLDRCIQPASAWEGSGAEPILCANSGSAPLPLDQCSCGTSTAGLHRREQRRRWQGCWLKIGTDEVLTTGGNERSDGKWGRLTPITNATCQKPACWVVAASTNCVWIVNKWLGSTSRGAREQQNEEAQRGSTALFFCVKCSENDCSWTQEEFPLEKMAKTHLRQAFMCSRKIHVQEAWRQRQINTFSYDLIKASLWKLWFWRF